MSATNPSLVEFIQQARRGANANSVLGPEYLMKQSYFTVDTSTNIFTSTFGRKIWQALNNQVRFFNAIQRSTWGNTVGWRVRTDRGSGRSRPITETGTLPTIDVSNIQTVSSLPRIVGTDFGVSIKSIFTAGLEGGAGDVLAMEMENSQLDHIKEVNEELLAGGAYLISAGAAASGDTHGGTFTVPASIAHHFKPGDRVAHYDITDPQWQNTTGLIISSTTVPNTTTGVVTIDPSTDVTEAPADGDLMAIYSRAGFTSIDDIVSFDGVRYGGIANTGDFASAGGIRAYDFTFGGRAAAGDWNAAASVQANAGVGRDLSLNLIDTAIQNIRINGGEPKLILLGHDQYYRLERLLNTQQRYFGEKFVQVGVGSEKTFEGTATGLVVATYQGIPVLPDADVAHSVATDDTVLGSNVYVLDTDYMEVAIAQPTQFYENRDYFAANALVVRGLFYTMGELRCYSPNRQAKVIDLN